MRVKEIFASLQGEGPDVGTPAVFIRLAGCNLSCSWCDTDHTTDAKEMCEADIMYAVEQIIPPNRFVVITGGEPFTQPLSLLVKILFAQKCAVQIETNGTLWQPEIEWAIPKFVSIVCSPKPSHAVRFGIVKNASAFKFVVGAEDRQECYTGPIPTFVQPRDDHDDEKNKANLRTCIDLCMRRGWRLSLQTQKIIGVQ
jgi:organic radical activating enzyme